MSTKSSIAIIVFLLMGYARVAAEVKHGTFEYDSLNVEFSYEYWQPWDEEQWCAHISYIYRFLDIGGCIDRISIAFLIPYNEGYVNVYPCIQNEYVAPGESWKQANHTTILFGGEMTETDSIDCLVHWKVIFQPIYYGVKDYPEYFERTDTTMAIVNHED